MQGRPNKEPEGREFRVRVGLGLWLGLGYIPRSASRREEIKKVGRGSGLGLGFRFGLVVKG
jgi:hypothetical protein